MKAIIIGGGIGGPVAAMALQQVGVDAVVHEAHASPAESLGLFLGLGVNGMRVLRQLGALDALERADTIATPRMVFSSTTGRRLGTVSNGWLDPETPSVTLMRGALQRVVMEEALRRGIEVRYGERFTSLTQRNGRVVARFEDGSETEGDVLIGADGIGSRVRRQMDPHAPRPSYTGLLNLGGVVEDSGLPATRDEMHMVWGRRAFFGYTVREGGESWWFANVAQEREPGPGHPSMPADGWKRRLQELFREDPPFIADLIGRTAEIGAYPIHDMPRLDTWHRGRVVLLGDAAHAVSPSAGQGASMAVEDALVLATCLRDIALPERALARYEALRRPRAERVVATGRRRGNYKALESRVAVWLRDLAMPLAMKLFATERAMSWLYDYEIPWDEPAEAAPTAPPPTGGTAAPQPPTGSPLGTLSGTR